MSLSPVSISPAQLAALRQAASATKSPAAPVMEIGGLHQRNMAAKAHSTPEKPDASFQQLEAMIVRNLIGSMVPKEGFGGAGSGLAGSGLAGSGLAGEYWGSMLANELANSLSSSGELGIAEIIQRSFKTDNS
jgi:Rod binding domain-containing protein